MVLRRQNACLPRIEVWRQARSIPVHLQTADSVQVNKASYISVNGVNGACLIIVPPLAWFIVGTLFIHSDLRGIFKKKPLCVVHMFPFSTLLRSLWRHRCPTLSADARATRPTRTDRLRICEDGKSAVYYKLVCYKPRIFLTPLSLATHFITALLYLIWMFPLSLQTPPNIHWYSTELYRSRCLFLVTMLTNKYTTVFPPHELWSELSVPGVSSISCPSEHAVEMFSLYHPQAVEDKALRSDKENLVN